MNERDIVTTARQVEHVLRENLRAAERRIQQAVCPIYGADDRGKPYLIGSSLLLKVHDRSFLVTAAHVLDWNQETSIYVAGRLKPVRIEGESYRTSPPATGRNDDLMDFGIIDISGTPPDQWSRYRFLTPDDLDVDDFPADHTLYGFSGYPVTKNRVYSANIKLSSMACIVIAAPPAQYSHLGLQPASHFLGQFDRTRQVDSVKGLMTGPDPHGLSGGGVWRMGTPGEFAKGTNSERLIGIGIEHRQDAKVLLGVRVSLLVVMIARIYPDLAGYLPTPQRVLVGTVEVGAPLSNNPAESPLQG
jgi:hypothetical protein